MGEWLQDWTIGFIGDGVINGRLKVAPNSQLSTDSVSLRNSTAVTHVEPNRR